MVSGQNSAMLPSGAMRWMVQGAVDDLPLMATMFRSARAFDQDIGGWNVANVTTMGTMFDNAVSFKQDISRWDVSKVANFDWFLNGTFLPTEYYNRLLMRWSNLDLRPGVTFRAGTSKYDLGLPQDRRQYIKDTFGWTITDGGSTDMWFLGEPTVMAVR